MYLSIIRIIIIILSVFLLIVVDPSKWTTGVFALLKNNEVETVTTKVGVVDRIENNKAVVLIDNETEEEIINKNDLPKGCEEGTWVLITKFSDDTYTIEIQKELTEKKKKESILLMKKLLEKNK